MSKVFELRKNTFTPNPFDKQPHINSFVLIEGWFEIPSASATHDA